MQGREPAPRAALFRNDRNLKFTDITDRAGVANERWGFGVAAGDIDNDGWTDLYVTNYGTNRLYRNNRDGTFTDVAERMGVDAGGWSTGASFGDYDEDGRLDLFVAGYVDTDPERAAGPLTPCTYRGERVMCGPRGLAGAPDRLFRNEGESIRRCNCARRCRRRRRLLRVRGDAGSTWTTTAISICWSSTIPRPTICIGTRARARSRRSASPPASR